MMGKNPMVFALHASARGFSYVVFSGPFSPHDWGTVGAKGDKNSTCLRRLEELLDRYSPEVLVLEEARSVANRSDRIARLYKAIAALCQGRGIDLAVYQLGQIKACFAHIGARTRQEIAEATARQLPMLDHRLPKPRKQWQSESRRMPLFCAAALALTHYQLGMTHRFDDL